MTSIDVVGAAKAKIDAISAKGLSYVPQILDAHKKAQDAEKFGFWRVFDAAVAVGELLNAAKEATKSSLPWPNWRAEHVPDIKQSMASLYMRIATNKDKIKNP